MFKALTDKIASLVVSHPNRIAELNGLMSGSTNVYIDYANIRPWSNKLGWHIDLRRLKQFLSSFDNIKSIKIYHGTLIGDKESEKNIKEMKKYFDLKTKPVKILKHSIYASSISSTSADLLKKFIRNCLLKKYDLETVEYLNFKFKEMNKNGVYYIEDLKCNFDVEIGRDMLLDYERNSCDTFVLWSVDSDFADPVSQLIKDNKKVILFATAGKVSAELNELTKSGLIIFEINKIRNFICWKKEINKSG